MRRFFSYINARRWRSAAVIATAALLVSVLIPLPASDLSPLPVISLRITDRNDVTLREALSDQEGRACWLRKDEIPRSLIDATIAAEDRYFYYHPGINPLSVARAFFQDVKAMRLVSGGSTITQQVARNIYHEPRTIPGKIAEAWLSIRLEMTISKEQILLQYLNRVPYGNGTFGAEAASRLYFDKPVSQVSLAEAAFLAGLPNSPSRSNPYRSFGRAVSRQRFMLKRMLDLGYISQTRYDRAIAEQIMLQPLVRSFKAPHFVDMVLASIPEKEKAHISAVRTTLDWNIQKAVELLLKGHIAALKKSHVTNGAVVVIDNATCEVVALAGSVDYFDSTHDGQFDGALARRQPGSALKPFVYGLAIEGGMTAADIIPDIPFAAPAATGVFSPENYDRKFHGPVRLRTALASSYNVPAVRVANRIGLNAVLAKLQVAGLTSLDQPASHYGLGLVLGDGEVTLLNLTRAYSMLARGGYFLPDRTILSLRDVAGKVRQFRPTNPALFGWNARTVFSPQVAYIITSILSDDDARAPAFGFDSRIQLPFPCAVKTGTSKDYKDNWTVGFTPRWTVGVWVGNFDSKPMQTVSGITGAGPVFRDVMLYLQQGNGRLDFQVPEGIVRVKVCTRSGKLPTPECPGTMDEVFIKGTQPTENCDWHHVWRVDKGTGMPAGAGTAAKYAETRVVETLPPIFGAWLNAEGKTGGEGNSSIDHGRFGANERSADNPMASVEFGIASPENGAVFKLDPTLRRQFQVVGVKIIAGPSYHDLRLFIDGKFYSSVSSQETTQWPLVSGKHEFELKGEKGPGEVRTSRVSITVY